MKFAVIQNMFMITYKLHMSTINQIWTEKASKVSNRIFLLLLLHSAKQSVRAICFEGGWECTDFRFQRRRWSAGFANFSLFSNIPLSTLKSNTISFSIIDKLVGWILWHINLCMLFNRLFNINPFLCK